MRRAAGLDVLVVQRSDFVSLRTGEFLAELVRREAVLALQAEKASLLRFDADLGAVVEHDERHDLHAGTDTQRQFT